MEGTAPKRLNRWWLVVAAVLLTALVLVIWMLTPPGAGHDGDTTYRRMTYYHRSHAVWNWIAAKLPDPLYKPFLSLSRKATSNFADQLGKLAASNYSSQVSIELTNQPLLLTSVARPFPEKELRGLVNAAAPDSRFPPLIVICVPSAGGAQIGLLCRTKDAAAYATAFGSSNRVEILRRPGFE